MKEEGRVQQEVVHTQPPPFLVERNNGILLIRA